MAKSKTRSGDGSGKAARGQTPNVTVRPPRSSNEELGITPKVTVRPPKK